MPVRPRRRALATALLASLAAAGCYGYVAPPPGASLAGREVQLWLSDSGAVVLTPTLGPAVESVVGRVLSDTGSTVVMAVTATQQRGGAESAWHGERVAISRTLIIDAGTRRFSASRTALFGGILGAGLIAARQAFQGRGSGGGGGGVGQAGGLR